MLNQPYHKLFSKCDPSPGDVRVDAICGSARNVHLIHYFVDCISEAFRNVGVSSQSDPEIVVGPTDKTQDGIFELICQIVGAEIDVLELHILEQHEALDFLAI